MPDRWPRFLFFEAGPLHTRRCGGTLSKQERAGAARDGAAGNFEGGKNNAF
nr:MAG TPA: hypothetical protein [Caudoviricetes sp.]